jgi:WD40 repeat protein
VSAKPVVLAGHEGPVSALAFSLDGNWLATVSGDNTVQLWDVTNPNSTAKPVVLRGHEGPVSVLAFSPDGYWLATGSQDQTARLWSAAHPLAKVEDKQDIHELIGLACQIIGRNLTQEEWQQFLGDQPYHKTCPNLLEFEEEPKS